jgi:hypothetical protein
MSEPLYDWWQGQRGQDLRTVIAEARQHFIDRFGLAPAEVLVPETGAGLGRPVAWLHYRAERWHVAVGPVPALGWDAKPRAYAQEGMPL